MTWMRWMWSPGLKGEEERERKERNRRGIEVEKGHRERKKSFPFNFLPSAARLLFRHPQRERAEEREQSANTHL